MLGRLDIVGTQKAAHYRVHALALFGEECCACVSEADFISPLMSAGGLEIGKQGDVQIVHSNTLVP